MIANSGALRFHIGLMTRNWISRPTSATTTMLTMAASAIGQPMPRQQRMGEHAAEHDEHALREVDDAAGVVNDAKADGDQPVDEPDADAVDQTLDEFNDARHALPPRCRDRRR